MRRHFHYRLAKLFFILIHCCVHFKGVPHWEHHLILKLKKFNSRQYPFCMFPTAVNKLINVKIMTANEIKKEMEENPILVFEKDRLQTFNQNWKDLGFKYCTPENFAAAGFYNCNTSPNSDTVKCFSCQKELSDWEEDDDPWEEHLKRRNKCPFVLFKNKTNPTIRDFLQLYFETKKIILNNYFDSEKKNLNEKKTVLLKKFAERSKSKK